MQESRLAGDRLKRAVHVGRAKVDITSDIQLARRAGVSYDTLMNWFGGRTTPRPHAMRKVAKVIGVSYAELWAAYEGRDVEPLPLADSVRELVGVLHELIAELRQERISTRGDGAKRSA